MDPDQTPQNAASDLGLHCLRVSLLWDARLKWVSGMGLSRRNCDFVYMWIAKAQIRYACAQPDLGFHAPLTESCAISECMNGEQRPG